MSIFSSDVLKFLKNCLCVLLVAFFCDLAFGTLFLIAFRSGVCPPDEEIGYQNQLLKKSKPDTLILGASHAQSIMPDKMDAQLGSQSYNYSGYQHMIGTNLSLVKILNREKQLGKRVIISASSFFLNSRSSLTPLLYRGQLDEIFPEVYRRQSFYSLCFASRESIDQFSSLFFQKLLGFKRDHRYKPREDGFFIFGSGTVSPSKKPKTFAKVDFSAKNEALLSELLSFLDNLEVRVYLVETPEYYPSLMSQAGRDRYYETLKRAVTGHEKAYVITFNEGNDSFLKNEKYFRDGGWGTPNSHVSPEGSAIFSKFLGRVIRDIESNPSTSEKIIFAKLPD